MIIKHLIKSEWKSETIISKESQEKEIPAEEMIKLCTTVSNSKENE